MEWNDLLRCPSIDDEKISHLEFEIKNNLNYFNQNIIDYENNLLMKKKISFEKLNDPSFGYLVIKENHILFSQESYYDGELKDFLIKNGKGTFYFNNGDKYCGEWKNNMYDGYGTYCFGLNNCFNDDDEVKFEGHWRENKRNGFGTSYFNNGKILRRNFENNIADKDMTSEKINLVGNT
jgi:hypothetical protein